MSYTFYSKQTVIVSERLCEHMGFRPGRTVLDIACGLGNTALAAARRLGNVTGIDINEEYLGIAKQRAVAEGLDINFERGDATSLNFEAGHFDTVLSTFGSANFWKQEAALSELLRVCRTGGTIGLTAWGGEGAVAIEDEFFALLQGEEMSNAEKPISPWLNQETALQQFDGQVENLTLTHHDFIIRDTSLLSYAQRMVDLFASDDYSEHKKKEVIYFLCENFSRINISGDHTLLLPYDYVEIIAQKS
jgi:ubiquinone/menaquinone biosynthesis C-methylase UbiE